MRTTTRRGQLFASTILSSALLAALVFQANMSLAAQTNNAFNVVVKLNNNNGGADSAFCRSNTGHGSFGATVTVVCATGAVVDIAALGDGMPWKPTHGGAYRFITQFSTAADYKSTINDRGICTVTSWRTVYLQDRDYLELLIGW